MPMTGEELERWFKLDQRVHRMSEQMLALSADAVERGYPELSLCYTASVKRWTAAREAALAGVRKKAGLEGRPVGGETLNKDAERRPM